MLTKAILPVLGFAALGQAAYDIVEQIDGYTFYHSGPTKAEKKSEYELSFCRTALAKLNATADDATCLPTLQALKATKTPEEFLTIFDTDIRAADADWHAVVNNSTGTSNISANADVVVIVPGITAVSFAAYYVSKFAQESYLNINPEHYINRDDGALKEEILEGWGGVTTHFTLATTVRSQYTYLPALPDFLIKVASDKILRDGTDTKFGVVDIALKDVVGPEAGLEVGTTGVRILSSVWYGDGASPSFVEGESEHVVVEIINHALNAKKGYDSGEIVLTELLAAVCVLIPTLAQCAA